MPGGLAIMLLNMFAAELGYRVSWLTPPAGEHSGIMRLENVEGDSREFEGKGKFTDAVEWLRKKL